MKRGKLVIFSIISTICVVAAVAIVLLYLNMSEDTAEVRLPEESSGVSSDVGADNEGEGELNELVYAELRPDTVQYVLEIIEKPKSYSCKYTVESFWDGGKGNFNVSVYVKDGVFSVSILNDAYMKRSIFTDEDYYIWYVDEDDYYEGTRGSAIDEERIAEAAQMSGSYETLMELEIDDILETKYMQMESAYCIYVKAEIGAFGYISEYYIYPDTGLLLKNDIYDGDKLIYSMNSSDLMLSVPNDECFLLPGGKLVS